jgi:ribosome biogenesis GTPase
MKGIIIKNQNGYFSIYGDKGTLSLCRSRGKLKRSEQILVGDTVEYEIADQGDGIITHVYPRHTILHRPVVANVDCMVLVASIKTPDFNPFLLDKMIVLTEQAGIKPLIIISKADLSPEDALRETEIYKKAGYSSIAISVNTETGFEQCRDLLSEIHGIISFSGASGVGKSSMLNHLLGKNHFISGEISRNTGRGKNTTRHAELVPAFGNSFLMDTPGYTFLELSGIEKEDLAYLFRDFRPYLGKCQFNNCRHNKEPGCRIRQAVEEGDINPRRYSSYLQMLNSIDSTKIRR